MLEILAIEVLNTPRKLYSTPWFSCLSEYRFSNRIHKYEDMSYPLHDDDVMYENMFTPVA